MTILLTLLACGKTDHGDCQAYIDCTEAVGLPAGSLETAYGADGSCWSGDEEAQETCRQECLDGIAILVEGDGKGLGECEATKEPAGANPLVPDELWSSWKYEVESACDEGEDIVFIYGTAQTDADGNFTGTESWYWFDDTPLEYEDDAVDVLEYTGTAMSAAEIAGWTSSESEEGYDLIRNATELGTGTNYGEDTEIKFILDTLTPNGELNFDNRMILYRFKEGSSGWYKEEYGVLGKTFFYPDSDEKQPPAHYEWQARKCY